MTSTVGPEDALAHRVTAIVPVKRLALAKSRLAVPVDQRQALALAFALDTVAALSGSPLVAGVLVVTPDPVVTSRVRRPGVRVTPDRGTGLTQAVHEGVRIATAWRPGTGVVVVPADLPCLSAADVTRVVTDATDPEGAFVPDRSGTGTTLVVYPPLRRARTRYGPDSAAAHRSLGLRALDHAPRGARHDVDDLADLREARALGPGPETLAVLERLDLTLEPCPP